MENDKFEQKLDNTLKELQSCQMSKGIDSCMKCEKLIGCPMRLLYVRSVYESMSKGEIGGFDFN